jgi:ribonuclease G
VTIDAILSETTPRAMRIALMAGDRLVELHIDRPGRGHREGDVFVGRVSRVVPALDACFVELPEGVSGFLRTREADRNDSGEPLSRLVQEGQKIAVAVKAEAHDEKGPLLTCRFEDKDGAIAAAALRSRGPRLLARARMLLARLADAFPEARIVADSPTELVALRRRERAGEVILHQGGALFENAGVEEQIEAALAPRMALASGATLLFEPGQTLTAIDVDTARASEGARDPLAVNLEAVPVIARQLRLRNIGGLVVVDFLNMKGEEAARRLMQGLAEALRGDPAETASDGPSRFGAVEIARRRRGPTMAETVGSPPVAAAEALIRRLRREAAMQGGATLVVRASPEVARVFAGDDGGKAIANWVGRRLELVSEPGRAHHETDIAAEL